MHFLIARFQLLFAAEQALQQGGRFDVYRLQFGQEDAREIANRGGMAEIFLHEMFNSATPGRINISHALGHFDLQIKRQLVIGALGQQMQLAPRRPKEVMCLGKGVIFVLGKHAQPYQFGSVLNLIDIFGDPI